jgi:dUTP pyrophosphatase
MSVVREYRWTDFNNIPPRVGHFEKVSFEQFKHDIEDEFDGMFSEEDIREIWENISLPTRATMGSSGYDFKAPFMVSLEDGEEITIPTGIRVKMNPGWWLMCIPRSGSGFKYYARLANLVGNIDEDYFYSKNEGHIKLKIRVENNKGKMFSVNSGDGIMQAIFVPFGITDDDNADGVRDGGFGSTGR